MDKFSASLREECEAWIAVLAGPQSWKDSQADVFVKVGARSGLSARMVKSLYFGEINDANHPAVKALKNAAEKHELEFLVTQIDELGRRVRSLIRRQGRADEQLLPL